jgi:uroporphyrinogen decarboxylase
MRGSGITGKELINQMRELDVKQFIKDNEEARKDNCFNPDAKQVGVGIHMGYQVVYDELGVNDGLHPWAKRPVELMKKYIALYNDKAEEIIGWRIMNEDYPPKLNIFPPFKRVGDIFEGRYFVQDYVEWLEASVSTPKELEALLDRVEKLDLQSFIIPENWEKECRRIFNETGLTPDPIALEGHFMRGPVTAATSLMKTEDFLLLYYDEPELFRRFSQVMGNVMLERIKIIDRACGYTEENRPHGFQFNDDNCCLLTPEMYEAFGYPVLKKIFDYSAPLENDFRYQHSDSDMAHIIPILARFNFTGVNFGPNVLVDMIRPYMPGTRIDGCIAPLVLQRNDEEELVRQAKRDCETAVKNGWRGLNLAAAGSTSYGSRLSSLRLLMQAVQNFGRYDP